MSEEFLYGCGVIPRGSNRLIHMTDSTDEDASDVIASGKSVVNLKAEQKKTVDEQINELNTNFNSKITQLNNNISALQETNTAMQNKINEIEAIVEADPIRNFSISRTSDLEPNTDFTIDSYIVGSKSLTVWLNGLRCQESVDYNEIGTNGQKSTKIQFTDTVTADICIAWEIC